MAQPPEFPPYTYHRHLLVYSLRGVAAQLVAEAEACASSWGYEELLLKVCEDPFSPYVATPFLPYVRNQMLFFAPETTPESYPGL